MVLGATIRMSSESGFYCDITSNKTKLSILNKRHWRRSSTPSVWRPPPSSAWPGLAQGTQSYHEPARRLVLCQCTVLVPKGLSRGTPAGAVSAYSLERDGYGQAMCPIITYQAYQFHLKPAPSMHSSSSPTQIKSTQFNSYLLKSTQLNSTHVNSSQLNTA